VKEAILAIFKIYVVSNFQARTTGAQLLLTAEEKKE
jgi:hypothetical protein